MRYLYDTCVTLGLDQVSTRRDKLVASFPVLLSENCLFFICAYDYIVSPDRGKFLGIEDVFIDPNGAFNINLGEDGIAYFRKIVYGGAPVMASVEGTSGMTSKGWQSGEQIEFSPASMLRGGGVRAGGAGNYNLRAQALEYIFSSKQGLNSANAVKKHIVPTLLDAFARSPSGATAIQSSQLERMEAALAPYWGADTAYLGL